MKKTFILFNFFLLIFFILLFFHNSFSKDKLDNKDKVRRTFRIWEGTDPKMKVSELAAYCAPIFWFSADEPELRSRKGKDIRIPTTFPFEPKADSPVVYYQLAYILTKENARSSGFKKNFFEPGNSDIDLNKIAAFDIYYSHFYNFEAGLGHHQYDTEQAQFQFLVISRIDTLKIKHYTILFVRVTAKAHALDWYDNIYEIDTDHPDYDLTLPFHILVEEGKHASCTDMNGDGYYTPGYDVNIRTNDAWGVRDVIRSGTLFSADFQSYMAKVRRPEYRVFPPLPNDSPLRKKYTKDSVYAPDNAIYQLRPLPSPSKTHNPLLKHDMDSYYIRYAPEISPESATNNFIDWFVDENFINSFAVSYRSDESSGISFCFPLLIVKNVEAPLVGGWLVNRMYFEDLYEGTFGYNVLYTPSASRFFDPYLSAGVEIQKLNKDSSGHSDVKSNFVFETGVKFRGNVTYSPLKFLRFLSPFWGLRLGIKNEGFMAIDHFNYVIEVGAGVW